MFLYCVTTRALSLYWQVVKYMVTTFVGSTECVVLPICFFIALEALWILYYFCISFLKVKLSSFEFRASSGLDRAV